MPKEHLFPAVRTDAAGIPLWAEDDPPACAVGMVVCTDLQHGSGGHHGPSIRKIVHAVIEALSRVAGTAGQSIQIKQRIDVHGPNPSWSPQDASHIHADHRLMRATPSSLSPRYGKDLAYSYQIAPPPPIPIRCS
jgi:hypothetical protein